MLLIFLGKGVESYELGCFVDVFAWNKYWGSKEPDLQTAAIHDSVHCMGGNLKLTPDKTLDQINADDYSGLAIPGGFCDEGFFEDMYDERFLQLVRAFDAAGKPIASICVGAMGVGKSGVLKDRRATTFKSEDNHRRNQLAEFGATVLDQNMVVDRNIITSNGPESGIGVALKLLELMTDKVNSDRVGEMMGF